MAKYDIHEFGNHGDLVLDVQTDLLNDLNTRIVVPLIPIGVAPKPAQYLNPKFEIAEDEYVMVTQFLSSVPSTQLRKTLGNLSDHSTQITRALDMVLQGF